MLGVDQAIVSRSLLPFCLIYSEFLPDNTPQNPNSHQQLIKANVAQDIFVRLGKETLLRRAKLTPAAPGDSITRGQVYAYKGAAASLNFAWVVLRDSFQSFVRLSYHLRRYF